MSADRQGCEQIYGSQCMYLHNLYVYIFYVKDESRVGRSAGLGLNIDID